MKSKKTSAKRTHRLSFEEALTRREAAARRHPRHRSTHESTHRVAVDEGPTMIRFTDVGGTAL